MSEFVPEGWKEGALSEFATINPKLKSDVVLNDDVKVSFIKMEDVSNNAQIKNKRVRNYSEVSKGFTKFNNHDVLVAKITPCFENGKGGYAENLVNGIGFGSTEFHVLRAKTQSDSKYIYQYTNYDSFRLAAEASMCGTGGQRRVQTDFIKTYRTAFPPLPEQKKIAAILTSVDDVIEKTQAQINKLKDLKTGMMQELLTRGVGVDGKPHTEFKDSPVGRIPKAWDCVRLEFLLKSSKNSMRSGPFGSALLKHELVPSGHPYLGIDNVHIERFENKFKRFVSDEKFEQLQRYAVQEDDVMITIMGTVGRSCVVPKGVGKALSSKHVWTMSFEQQKYIPALICWQLNYSDWIKLQFKNESQGGVMESISSKTLKELWLPLPPISEQNKINKVHKSLSESIRVKEGLLYKHKQLKKALMQDLLTGKVRVKVDS
jgi:type I restriction enzyme S subunit